MAYDINCPHCGYGHNVEDFDGVEGVIGEHKIKCELCKKPFTVEVYTIFEYFEKKDKEE